MQFESDCLVNKSEIYVHFDYFGFSQLLTENKPQCYFIFFIFVTNMDGISVY